MNTAARVLMIVILLPPLVSQAPAQLTSSASVAERTWNSYNQAGIKALRQRDYAQAEKQFQAALEEAERLGSDDPHYATSLNNLSSVYKTEGRFADAEPLYRRSLEIYEKAWGPESPDLAGSLENYAALLRQTSHMDEASKLEARAKAIRDRNAQR
jgi:tetratricopeptide (TPR) repeat protein